MALLRRTHSHNILLVFLFRKNETGDYFFGMGERVTNLNDY